MSPARLDCPKAEALADRLTAPVEMLWRDKEIRKARSGRFFLGDHTIPSFASPAQAILYIQATAVTC